jgi:outer membrane lipoprotein-sorting protein
MVRSIDASKLSGSEQTATLVIIDEKGNTRERTISTASKHYAKDDVTKTLMRFIAPADVKGTSILMFEYALKDNDMWIYMPALRKTRRIVSSEKSKSFMGSEFTNADISSPKLDEYTFKLLGSEPSNGVDCWQIEMTPISKDIADAYGYSKRVMLIGKQDYVTRYASYYDLNGGLLKVSETSEIKELDKVNHKYQVCKSQMTNKQNGRISRFTISNIVNNPNVKDSYFTTQYLEKP